jgi:hypothetical protein
VGGEITGSFCPFQSGLAIGLAVGTRFVWDHSVTPFTGLHDGITSPTIVGTAVLLHEDTFCSYFDRLTNHGLLPPFSIEFFFFKGNGNDWSLLFYKSAQKKELPNLATRFGLIPIEIPYLKTQFNTYLFFCQEKFLDRLDKLGYS